MKIIAFFLLLTSLLQAESTIPIQLINGKDLTGWRIQCLLEDTQKAKTYWTSDGNTITVDTKGDKNHNYVWLITEKEYNNFDLTLKIRQPRRTTGNSGIQIRSRYSPHPKGKGMWMHGPQIDIHPPKPFRTGLIYDETFETQHWIHPIKPSWTIKPGDTNHKVDWKPNEWNTLRIRANGTKIQTWLNGNLIADYNGEGTLNDKYHKKHNVGLTGHIALQLHKGHDLSLQFKDILLTPISTKK